MKEGDLVRIQLSDVKELEGCVGLIVDKEKDQPHFTWYRVLVNGKLRTLFPDELVVIREGR